MYFDQSTLGHRFERRFGHANRQYSDEQRAPIFFQFLDCVFQLLHQFPTSFEFNSKFLEDIAHHTVSLRFGTFLFDTEQQRRDKKLKLETVSLWSYMNSQVDLYRNIFYKPNYDIIIPITSASHFVFWSDFFLQDHHSHAEFKQQTQKCMEQINSWKEEADSLRMEVERLKKQLEEQNK